MESSSGRHFIQLKQALLKTAQSRLNIHKAFAEWSLGDIADFQADLEAVCKSSISEKWFYNHLKNESERLPRIDVLNLLAGYVGYKNWDDFRLAQPQENKGQPVSKLIFLAPFLILLSAAYFLWPEREHRVVLLLQDAYTREHIPLQRMKIWGEDQKFLNPQSNGSLKPTGDTLFVDGPYYKPGKTAVGTGDTLRLTLYPDDYALMLNYFSRSTAENWQKRRQQLLEAIHEEAKIFQSHPQYEGIELLNRNEFIDRLILPINSLRNLEIQDIVYKDKKIYRLRFTQNLSENED